MESRKTEIAIIAHGLIGISLVWDKVLLKRRGTQNLFSYVFWLGAVSIFGLLLIPFGYRRPSFQVIAIAFGAGAIDLAASFFYYAWRSIRAMSRRLLHQRPP